MSGIPQPAAAPGALLVCECGAPAVDLGIPASRMEYRFIPNGPEDGFSAWPVDPQGGASLVEVAQAARAFDHPFLRQGLNRLVAQAILEQRVSVLVVAGFWGCTVDLPRIADLLGIHSVFILHAGASLDGQRDDATEAWITDALARCRYLVALDGAQWPRGIAGAEKLVDSSALSGKLNPLLGAADVARRFDYSTYEFVLRDHPLLYRMQAADVEFFRGSEHVLDVACGAGIFLDCLRQEGIRATGIERDASIAAYATGMGLHVVNQDVMTFLESSRQRYDGIYCSHFVEHLPVAALQRFIELLFATLSPGGLAVLVFPDPESIRSQLLGFWRDPEHVRFYHPDLVVAMATVAGFTLEATNYDTQPHRVIPFDATPPPLPASEPLPALPAQDCEEDISPSPWLARLGWRSRQRAAQREAAWRRWAEGMDRVVRRQQEYLEGLQARTDTLWTVNATWAWHDNATIRLRRPSRPGA